MGKSTLLRNLKGFLPISTRTAVVSMQNPDAFASQSDLFRTLLQEVAKAVPNAGLTTVEAPSLQDFFQRLAECNTQLEKDKCRLLLAIDEYENLDRKLGKGYSAKTCWRLCANPSSTTAASSGCSPVATPSTN